VTLLSLVAGGSACTGGKKAISDPSSTSVSSTTSTAPTATTSPPASVDPAAREIRDRQAVEDAWTKFWGVYVRLHEIPPGQLQAAVDSLAVGVSKIQLLDEVKLFKATHRTSYGYVVNHPYWQQSVHGKSTATMGDCMDQSHYGSRSTSTHKTLTVGVPRDNTKATFLKGADGVWRVKLVEYLLDVKC
jgi:hypothetical protein